MTSNREIDGLAAEAAAEELAAGYYDAEPGVNYVFEDSEGEDFEDYCKELVRNGELLKAAVAGCTRLEDKIPPSLFEGLTFRQSLLVGNVHSLPRFGAGRDISVISNGNDQDKKDYQRGVKAWATFIWVFFGIWVVALWYCKWKRKLGWVSGSPPKRPETISEEKSVNRDSNNSDDKEEGTEEVEPQPQDVEGQESEGSAPGIVDDSTLEQPSNDDAADAKKEAAPTTEPETEESEVRAPGSVDASALEQPSNDDAADAKKEAAPTAELETEKAENETNEEEQEMEYQAKLAKFQRSLKGARIATCISVPLMCLFSILLIHRGFRSMADVIESAQVDIPNVLALTEPAQNATAKYAVGAKETINGRIEVIETLLECDFDLSNLEDIGFDSRFGSVRLNLTDKVAIDINTTEALLNLNETLNNVTTFADIFISIDDSLFNLNNNLNTMNALLDDIDSWWYIPVSAFVVMMDVMAISFMVSVVLAWKSKQPRLLRKVNRWCILPIFCLLLFASIMISTICLIVSEVLSDFCIEDPANQVESMIGASFPFDGYVKWYIRGCHDENRPTILLLIFPKIAKVFRALEAGLAALAAFVEGQGDKAPQICNGNVDLLQRSLSHLSSQFDALLVLVAEIYPLLQCPAINELYTHVSQDTTCDHAVHATTEIFSYLFLVAVCAMILITVRVAWDEVAEVGDDLAVAEDGDNVEERAMEAPADAPTDFAEKPDVDDIQDDGNKSEEIVIQESNASADEKAEDCLDMCGPVAAEPSSNCGIS